MRRQPFGDDGHCRRNEHSAHEALARAADNHGRKVGCNPAQHRKGGERADRDDEEGSQTEKAFQPGAQRNDHDFRNEKGGGDPGALSACGTDLTLYDRQSRIDD